MTIHMHPAMDAHLDTARAIIKAPRGTYSRDQEDDALDVLRFHGDFIDGVVADQFLMARTMSEQAKIDNEALARLREDWNRRDPWGTAFFFIAAGFLTATLIAVAVAG